MDTREWIIKGAARAHFVDVWANWQEQNGWPAGSPAGQDLMDMAPAETPVLYDLDARKLVRAVEDYNGADIVAMFAHDEGRLLAETFGHYLYMQAVGHGVGLWEWSDPWHDGVYDTPFWETIPWEPGGRWRSGAWETYSMSYCAVPGCDCKRPKLWEATHTYRHRESE